MVSLTFYHYSTTLHVVEGGAWEDDYRLTTPCTALPSQKYDNFDPHCDKHAEYVYDNVGLTLKHLTPHDLTLSVLHVVCMACMHAYHHACHECHFCMQGRQFDRFT